jgi:O-antigen/teichoic acid export membrane protein
LPFLLWIPLANFAGNIDRLILKNFWGLTEVGFFFAIQSLITLPQSISTAGMNLFYPQVSELASKKEFVKLQNYTDLIVKYLTLAVMPLIVLIFIFAKYLITLILGPTFEQATLTLQIFSIAILILTLSRPYSYILLGSDYYKFVPIINSLILMLIIILELVFIPKSIGGIKLFGLGSSGAALASLIAWSVSLLIFVFYSIKHLHIKFYLPIYKHVIAGIIMYVVVNFLESNLSQSIINIAFASVIGTVIFVFILIILGEVRRADYRYLQSIIRPDIVIDSIKKEWSKKQ